jgi:hypothetical protein
MSDRVPGISSVCGKLEDMYSPEWHR